MEIIIGLFGIVLLIWDVIFCFACCASSSTWWQRLISVLMAPLSLYSAYWLCNTSDTSCGFIISGVFTAIFLAVWSSWLEAYATYHHKK